MEHYINLDLADIKYLCEYDNIEKNEQWKSIFEYENLYEVSNLGRVKSLERHIKHSRLGLQLIKERIIKQFVNNKGYCNVSLTKNNKMSNIRVNRAVAIAFIPNPENKPQVNHVGLDKYGVEGCKLDNRAISLEWNTSKENVDHAFKNGLSKGQQGEKSFSSKLTEKEVLEIRKIGNSVTYKVLSKQYGVNSSSIGAILRREKWKHI